MGCKQQFHNGCDTEMGIEQYIGVFQADRETKDTQRKDQHLRSSQRPEAYRMFMNS